jgi:hypothetical protein
MKKNWIKLLLDVAMAVLLFTLFSTSIAGLAFHELTGLVIFGMVVIHLLLNWKWIWTFTKKLFSRNVPFKTRFGYILNILLMISFTMIIITGIMISKTVLVGVLPRVADAQVMHYFFSALSLVIIGVHTGLHWDFIKAMFGKLVKVPTKVGLVLSSALLVSILAFGSYSLITSRFTQWIAGPVLGEVLHSGESEGRGSGRNNRDESIDHSEELTSTTEELREFGGRGRNESSLSSLSVVAEMGSIMILIATVTAGTEILLKKRKKKAVVVS